MSENTKRNRRVTTLLTPYEREVCEYIARKRRVSLADVMRLALPELVAEYEADNGPPYEAA